MTKPIDPCKVITGPETRWNYLHVWQPYSYDGNSKPKYSVCLMIPKSDTRTLTRIVDAMEATYKKGKARLANADGTIPSMQEIVLPLKDGDAERAGNDVYADTYFINATSYYPPDIVDIYRQKITDQSLVYSGVYGRASIHFYTYKNSDGTCGIGCGLNNLQLVKSGEPLGGRTDAYTDFSQWDDDFLM